MQHDDYITIGTLKLRMEELREIVPVEPFYRDYDPFNEDKYDAWEELQRLEDVKDELNWCWNGDGTVLINDDYFDRYVEELMYDIGEVQRGGIVAGLIDWAKVSEAVVQDYKRVDIEGQAYWVRA